MKKYKSAIAYIAIYIVFIALSVLLAKLSRNLPPFKYTGALILTIANHLMFGVTIAVRVGLCINFPTRVQRIVLPAVFAVISVGVSFWLLYSGYNSYTYLWTVAAADIASIFIGLAKKR